MAKKIVIVFAVAFVILSLIIIILAAWKGGQERVYRPGVSLPAPYSLETESVTLEREAIKEVNLEDSSRLVIKTGTINIQVKDIEEAVKNIVRYTEEKSGWVVSSVITEKEMFPTAYVTVRLPAEFFEAAMILFKGLAEKVDFESAEGQDVTEEHVDLTARLRNLEATENQLLKIMERSGKISEVLEVQRELSRVREEIERIKGRIQYLEQSAEMATITVNLALAKELQPITPTEKWRPTYVFRQAWKNVLSFLKGISYLLIWIVTYAVVWLPIVIIFWLAWKFLKKRKEAGKIQ